MSTVMKVNFEPARDVLHVERGVFPLSDPTLANPLNPVALVDGEWLTLDSPTNYKLVRAAAIGTPGAEAAKRSWPHWNEMGRTDVQALGERRTVVLWGGFWEFDTRIYKDLVVGGGALFSLLEPVKVCTITIGSRNYCGLTGSQKSDTTAIHVGYVVKLPANNAGKLRIRGGMLF